MILSRIVYRHAGSYPSVAHHIPISSRQTVPAAAQFNGGPGSRPCTPSAFGWNTPDVTGLERLGTTRMCQYVRAWTNEWDLVRLDPTYRPRTEVATVTFSYAEQPDLDVNERSDRCSSRILVRWMPCRGGP